MSDIFHNIPYVIDLHNIPYVIDLIIGLWWKQQTRAGNAPTEKYVNPLKPEFTIVIFIHYKLRIAVAILDLQWMKMI